MDVKDRLEELMRLHAYSNARLGAKIGVGGSTIRRWRRGLTCPRVKEAQALAQVFGVAATQFLAGIEEVTPDDRQLLRAIRALGLDYDEALRRLSRADPTAVNIAVGLPPTDPRGNRSGSR